MPSESTVPTATGPTATGPTATGPTATNVPSTQRATGAMTDTGALRATAHPTRLKIMELLRQHPALTATKCANLLGESPKTCSYHLQTLAANGFVEEVPTAGRLRPWRLAREQRTPGQQTPGKQTPGQQTPDQQTPEQRARGQLAPRPPGRAAGENPLQRARERTRDTALRHDEALLTTAMGAIAAAAASPSWAAAVTVYDRVALMSAEEVQAWTEDVERVTRRHIRRSAQAHETGDRTVRLPVHLLFYGFPTTGAGRAG